MNIPFIFSVGEEVQVELFTGMKTVTIVERRYREVGEFAFIEYDVDLFSGDRTFTQTDLIKSNAKNPKELLKTYASSKVFTKNEVISTLTELLVDRETQLTKEIHQSYNYGFVAGEANGVKKAVKKFEDS